MEIQIAEKCAKLIFVSLRTRQDHCFDLALRINHGVDAVTV